MARPQRAWREARRERSEERGADLVLTPLEAAILAAAEAYVSPPLVADRPARRVPRPDPTPPRRSSPLRGPLLFAGLSVAAHAVIALLVPAASDLAVPRPVLVRLAREALVPGTGPAITGGRVPDTTASELVPGGAHRLEDNVDAPDRGVGGDGRGAIEIVLLVPHDDDVTLTDAPWNAVGPSQTSRIDVADDRATFETRRATPRPSEEPFVASGPGAHPERREVSALDAREGARTAPNASTAGIRTHESAGVGSGASATHEGRLDRSELGAAADSPGLGIADGEGARASAAAMVATGRPAVDPGTASTLAEARDRTRDDQDAELLASRLSESFVESSRRAGELAEDGTGGRAAPGPLGSGGGSAEGGRARALGTGDGGFESLDTSDERYRRWLFSERRRIEGAMIFPRARALAMDQGTSVFRVTLGRDGRIIGRPRLIRTSGFSDFDGAAEVAILAGPFAPVPDDVAPGRERVTISLSLQWWNPMVR